MNSDFHKQLLNDVVQDQQYHAFYANLHKRSTRELQRLKVERLFYRTLIFAASIVLAICSIFVVKMAKPAPVFMVYSPPAVADKIVKTQTIRNKPIVVSKKITKKNLAAKKVSRSFKKVATATSKKFFVVKSSKRNFAIITKKKAKIVFTKKNKKVKKISDKELLLTLKKKSVILQQGKKTQIIFY